MDRHGRRQLARENLIHRSPGVLVKLLFVLFLGGYIVSWRSDGGAGLIFVLWYAAMWGLSLGLPRVFIGDGGIAMGLPLFILGVLFLVRCHKKRGIGSGAPDLHA